MTRLRPCRYNTVVSFRGFFLVLSRSRSLFWSGLFFRRSVSVPRAFVLSGVPPAGFSVLCARLFVLGCSFVSCGCGLRSRSCWVCFFCPPLVAGRLALVLSAPPGFSPLFVSPSGRVLSGFAAARARAARGGRGSLRCAVQPSCCGGADKLPLR